MPDDWPIGTIAIRKTPGTETNNWGPYNFDLDAEQGSKIPSGDQIASFTVDAYAGSFQTTDSLAGLTDISSDLVDPDVALANTTSVMNVHFKYPGSSNAGLITLIFNVTLTVSSGVHPFYFRHVNVESST
ncbi:MAG TPA: hypothetical protein ENI05_13010 [Porticoccus sp.]|nr:hypothetical protein [Porticoccus sp.]